MSFPMLSTCFGNLPIFSSLPYPHTCCWGAAAAATTAAAAAAFQNIRPVPDSPGKSKAARREKIYASGIQKTFRPLAHPFFPACWPKINPSPTSFKFKFSNLAVIFVFPGKIRGNRAYSTIRRLKKEEDSTKKKSDKCAVSSQARHEKKGERMRAWCRVP